jgi:hypothetical protein
VAREVHISVKFMDDATVVSDMRKALSRNHNLHLLRKTETVKEQIVAGQWAASHKSWVSLLEFIDTKSGNVVSAQR